MDANVMVRGVDRVLTIASRPWVQVQMRMTQPKKVGAYTQWRRSWEAEETLKLLKKQKRRLDAKSTEQIAVEEEVTTRITSPPPLRSCPPSPCVEERASMAMPFLNGMHDS